MNCNKQGRSSRSMHEVARGGTVRVGQGVGHGVPPPQMERKWKSGNA